MLSGLGIVRQIKKGAGEASNTHEQPALLEEVQTVVHLELEVEGVGQHTQQGEEVGLDFDSDLRWRGHNARYVGS